MLPRGTCRLRLSTATCWRKVLVTSSIATAAMRPSPQCRMRNESPYLLFCILHSALRALIGSAGCAAHGDVELADQRYQHRRHREAEGAADHQEGDERIGRFLRAGLGDQDR